MRNIFGTLGRYTTLNNINLDNNTAINKPSVTSSLDRNGSSAQITAWSQSGPNITNSVTVNNIWSFLRQVFILGYEHRSGETLSIKDGDMTLGENT